MSILFPSLIFKSNCLSPKTFFRFISIQSFASLDHARPWRGSGDYTPPSLREGHGEGHGVIPGHFTWYYWWWIKCNWHRIFLGKPLSRWPFIQRKYTTRNSQGQNPATKSIRPRCDSLPTETQPGRSEALAAVLLKTQVF